MPAFYDEYVSAFSNLIGSANEYEAWYGREIGNADTWIDLFMETGIDFQSHAQTIDAFENFLIAYYPQEGMSGGDWRDIRQEFMEMYGIDDHSIDWEAYREAIGY